MKRKYFFVILFLIFTMFLVGCAKTTLTTIRNPELFQIKFGKILVVAPFSDIGMRKQTEDAFIAKFNLSGVNAISSMQRIPPVKDYSEQELLRILEQDKIDGILVAGLKDYWTSQTYVPKSSSSRGSASLYGNSLYYRSYTQEYGGYYISKPNVKFEIRLFDSRSGQVAWLATSLTKGNAFADYNTLANSLAKKVVKMLIEENILELTVTDIKEAPASATKTITITESLNQAPIASFTADFRIGVVPLEIYFDASNSYDPDGNIVSYVWDFKDGNTGSGETLNHTFSSIGSYKVELTVTDDKGATASATRTIIAKKSP
ncbi:hypothetical protein ES705_32885 [subsurface metagenome]